MDFDFAKIEALVRKALEEDLGRFVHLVVAKFEPAAHKKGLKIRFPES